MKALRWDAGKGAPSGNPNEFARNKKSPLRNRSVRGNFCWWAVRGSNPRQPACKAGALPTELTARGFLVEDRTLRVNGQGARSRTTTGCLPPEGEPLWAAGAGMFWSARSVRPGMVSARKPCRNVSGKGPDGAARPSGVGWSGRFRSAGKLTAGKIDGVDQSRPLGNRWT